MVFVRDRDVKGLTVTAWRGRARYTVSKGIILSRWGADLWTYGQSQNNVTTHNSVTSFSSLSGFHHFGFYCGFLHLRVLKFQDDDYDPEIHDIFFLKGKSNLC